MPKDNSENHKEPHAQEKPYPVKTIILSAGRPFRFLWRWLVKFWSKGWWNKAFVVIVLMIWLCVGAMYGISRWYAYSERNIPYTMGVSFIPDYASYLGLNPQKTLGALIGINIKNFRLTSYWNDIEPQKGQYDFSQLDWEFKQIDAAHGHVTLSIGLRQPRWPECHLPSWVDTKKPASNWEPALKSYMKAVINRYKKNPALASYQLENEYFNNFGSCHNYSRKRLISEFNMVKHLDPHHPIMISRSDNFGEPIGQPRPNFYGISIYRRVWSPWVHGYFEYPFPAWYYGYLAGVQKIFFGRDSIIHEFQAEPWPPDGKPMLKTSLAEQNQTFNAKRFESYFKFARATGMRTVYFWGAEYWYYRMTVEHDPSVWNVAKQHFTQQGIIYKTNPFVIIQLWLNQKTKKTNASNE